MPSEKNIRNAEILTEKLSKAKAVYFTEYLGLNVGELTNLRSSFFKAGVEYCVAKNSLLKLAIENNKLNVSDEIFDINNNFFLAILLFLFKECSEHRIYILLFIYPL